MSYSGEIFPNSNIQSCEWTKKHDLKFLYMVLFLRLCFFLRELLYSIERYFIWLSTIEEALSAKRGNELTFWDSMRGKSPWYCLLLISFLPTPLRLWKLSCSHPLLLVSKHTLSLHMPREKQNFILMPKRLSSCQGYSANTHSLSVATWRCCLREGGLQGIGWREKAFLMKPCTVPYPKGKSWKKRAS